MASHGTAIRGLSALATALLLAGCIGTPGGRSVSAFVEAPARLASGAPAPETITLPMLLDDNRIFLQVSFRRPDGEARPALVWMNMGQSGISLTPALAEALGPGARLTIDLGGMPVTAQPTVVQDDGDEAALFAQEFGSMPVEAMLGAAIWKQFRVTLDYQARTVTLARPSDEAAPGIPVPLAVNEGTALVSVDATVDGQTYPVVIDVGGGYTWLRGGVVRGWLDDHPDWYRADGAPGQSNQAMVDYDFEQRATVAKVGSMTIGALALSDVGVLGSGPASWSPAGRLLDAAFWWLWSKGAPGPVLGWLGGNALAPYRLTIDYRNHMSYWLRIAEPATDDLNSVGISLVHEAASYRVGGLVTRHGKAAVAEVQVVDTLAAIDGTPVANATRGEVIAALHGAPGQRKMLALQRRGQTVTVSAVVADYSDP